MSATISVPFDPARLKSLALQMSTGEFASITRAAAAAGIELPGIQPRPRRDAPPVLLPPDPNTGPTRAAPQAETSTQTSTPTIPNELPSPLLAVNPAGPDAPLSPKKAPSGRTPYGGPASEKPTRVEGDAPSPGTLALPAPQTTRRTWLIVLAGVAFVGAGVLVAVLMRS